jgi:predicted unusual protein kinase regulating ubiquinone biosynthesis (AarF/ABC1/UbiB family)
MTMGIKLDPQYLKRYKEIAGLLMKYGNSDLVKNAGLEEALKDDENLSKQVKGTAEELAADLERLGPAYVKLGQILSTRGDLLPPPYLLALSRLQDNCEPFSFAEVEKIIVSELGVKISKAFSEFNSEPLAAASLGQIHKAKMRDGREVAVKVQRPCIREQILQDLEIFADVAEFYVLHTELGKKYEFDVMVDEFRKSLLGELDYRQEAQNLETLRRIVEEFEMIKVPFAIDAFTTTKVLTMEFIKGKKVTDITNLERTELNGTPLAEQIFAAYLKQILVAGFFHADPHPGNVLLTEDEKQIALIDLGMVARLTPRIQKQLLQLVIAISEGRADSVANIAVEIGEPKPKFDEIQFRHKVSELVQTDLDANIARMKVGHVIVGITKAAGETGIRVPAELTMLGKAMLHLDEVGRSLDPNFDPNASVRRNAGHILEQRLVNEISPGNLLNTLIEAKDGFEKFPRNINKIMDLVAQNQLSVKVIDEPLLVDSFQKVANRITLGLVLAALIIGASNLMKVPSGFTLFGYPGLAILLFLMAAGGGFALAIQIAFYDQKPQKLGDPDVVSPLVRR